VSLQRNIYKRAAKIIKQDGFGYERFNGFTVNDIGLQIASYDVEIQLKGSVHAVSNSLAQTLGLDWKKKHIMIYGLNSILGVDRDYSGDIINFNGKRWQVLSENDWLATSDWTGVICVEVQQ
jgi:hypothetical protein